MSQLGKKRKKECAAVMRKMIPDRQHMHEVKSHRQKTKNTQKTKKPANR